MSAINEPQEHDKAAISGDGEFRQDASIRVWSILEIRRMIFDHLFNLNSYLFRDIADLNVRLLTLNKANFKLAIESLFRRMDEWSYTKMIKASTSAVSVTIMPPLKSITPLKSIGKTPYVYKGCTFIRVPRIAQLPQNIQKRRRRFELYASYHQLRQSIPESAQTRCVFDHVHLPSRQPRDFGYLYSLRR